MADLRHSWKPRKVYVFSIVKQAVKWTDMSMAKDSEWRGLKIWPHKMDHRLKQEEDSVFIHDNNN